MTSRYALTILALAATAVTACGRSDGGPGAAHAGAQVVPDAERARIVAPPELAPRADEPPADRPDAGLEGGSRVSGDVDPVARRPDEAPPGPLLAAPSATAPMASADLRAAATEADDAPAPGGVSPSPNVDRSFQDGPLFRDDDPLESAEIPVCRALVTGLEACWPKLDEELRETMEPLVASILNDARSLRRPFVRQRACRLGWRTIPRMLDSYCPGAFQGPPRD